MSKYNRKKKVAREDEFLDFWHRTYLAVAPYVRAIGVTIGTALVIVFAVWGISSYYEHRAEAASETFARATRIYEAELATADTPPPAADDEDAVPRFKTDKERWEATLAELSQLESKSAGSDVTRRAALFKAGVLYDQGKYDEARALFDRFAKDTSHPALAILAREGVALCHEAQGKLDDALSIYKELGSQPKAGDFYRDRALWAEARVLLKKGDQAGAVNALKQILAKVPTSSLKDEVTNKLAALGAAP